MAEVWQAQDERGSSSLIRLIAWIALNIGYRTGYLLLYPICLYFLLFSSRSRRASAVYLGRVFGRRPRLRDLFRHYFCFASTILDRPYFLTGRFASYDIRIHGLDALEVFRGSGQGGILMGSHIGSFEVLRCLAGARGALDLKIMMYVDKSIKINSIINELNPEHERHVIPLGRPYSVIEAHRAISEGSLVGILADRNSRGGKQAVEPFLGQPASFPLGPLMLAAKAGCPVVTFFAIYRGHRRYDIYFETLCERAPGDYRSNPDVLQPFVAEFARRMEERCKNAPFNWFNFYDFWGGDET